MQIFLFLAPHKPGLPARLSNAASSAATSTRNDVGSVLPPPSMATLPPTTYHHLSTYRRPLPTEQCSGSARQGRMLLRSLLGLHDDCIAMAPIQLGQAPPSCLSLRCTYGCIRQPRALTLTSICLWLSHLPKPPSPFPTCPCSMWT